MYTLQESHQQGMAFPAHRSTSPLHHFGLPFTGKGTLRSKSSMQGAYREGIALLSICLSLCVPLPVLLLPGPKSLIFQVGLLHLIPVMEGGLAHRTT